MQQSCWSSGDASFSRVETRLSIVVGTRLSIVVGTRSSIAIEMQPLIVVETWLSKCEDHVRCFQRERRRRVGRMSDSAIYAPHILATERPIKNPSLLTFNSLDCSSPSIRPAFDNQKLSSFLRAHKASSFFQIFSKISLSRWRQN